MNFLANIFQQLETAGDLPVLRRNGGRGAVQSTGGELLGLVGRARAFLASKGFQRGDRCALLAQNSIRWVAMNLAIMAEGLIVVPLYSRQAPAELVAIMKDCSPCLICCGSPELREAIVEKWAEAPPQYLFETIFSTRQIAISVPQLGSADPVTIIYTSGTSGDAKGVVLTAGNVEHMLSCTSGRLDTLMKNEPGQNRVFHYLPFCFAGSWIMLLTCLLRRNLLILNTDLNKLSGEMCSAAPHYFLNVPALLERMRKAVDEQLWKSGGLPQAIYSRGKAAFMRRQEEDKKSLADSLWLGLAKALVFPAIRKKMIGRNLKALICGSAPLNVDTQLYFHMLGIAVLQVYGLTETTAICTMDDPQHVVPGRVGPAIPGVEMKLGDNEEIMVQGPNIFLNYWNRPDETVRVLRDGWFHTGDQGEADASGNWRIIGRLKNLIILGSGHNIAPEPIEDKVLQQLPKAQQVVLMGNGRGYLSSIVTGEVRSSSVQAALDSINLDLPHYKQIRAFHIRKDPFSIDNGLLTANGKLKRDAIAAQMKAEIEAMYQVKQAS
jgi:long-chain acyl-CoA synthetase